MAERRGILIKSAIGSEKKTAGNDCWVVARD
jgi:hypothetical protein